MPLDSRLKSHVTKFSAKPPGHDAARQRENQRRHRARVKGKMSDLEAALASTQAELEAALMQIEHLSAEVERLRNLVPTSTRPVPQPASQSTTRTDEFVTDAVMMTGVAPTLPIPPAESVETCAENQHPDTSCCPETLASTDTPDAALMTSIDDPDSDCPLLPAPLPGESTITCRDAYKIIKDRNALSDADMDSEAMNGWLKSGYRRAIVPGSGCRVETHILFDFIDHITSN